MLGSFCIILVNVKLILMFSSDVVQVQYTFGSIYFVGLSSIPSLVSSEDTSPPYVVFYIILAINNFFVFNQIQLVLCSLLFPIRAGSKIYFFIL